ncbi:hypothetical protein OS493_034151 [Desmophyllum pertusum]|uniref:G-protein coupled receptors family 1 profile domain-containing protein n=1 Tax=Desmophyllum pertusum TaxID=174260 RepID=A0A9W9ZW68_9CNID|nr:hypothetical protein OS493_034151 [Desmophyllum pertusum]
MPVGDAPKSSDPFPWIWIPGWFLTLVGILGNTMVIYLIATNRRLRTQVNVLILSLAIADLCFCLSYFPAFFTCEFYLPCDRELRKIFAAYFAYTSLMNLCVLTADRYVAIVMPFKYVSFMTSRCVVTMVTLSWLLPAVFYFLVAITLKQMASEEAITTFRIVRVFVFQLTPCFSLLLATIHMFYIAKKHSKKMASLVSQLQFNHPISYQKQKDGLNSYPDPTQRGARKCGRGRSGYEIKNGFEISSARLVGVVVFVMVLCYAIDSYFDLRNYFSNFQTSIDDNDYIICLLYMTNSAANPLFYALLKHDIKKELKRLFFQRKKLEIGQPKGIVLKAYLRELAEPAVCQ